MAVDYDWVIVGGSATARYAAAQAAQRQARVAIVEPDPEANYLLPLLHRQTLLHAAQMSQRLRRLRLWGWQTDRGLPQWQAMTDWAEIAAEPLIEQGQAGGSLEQLAIAGVDVVVGQGEFCRRPDLGFAVNGRILRSRAFLLAPAVTAAIPPIAGLATIPYCTLETLWQKSGQPDRLIIVGNDPRGLELAQALNRLGTQVTLISGTTLLPQEDQEAAQLLLAQLEVEGVNILTQAVLTEATIHPITPDPATHPDSSPVTSAITFQLQIGDRTLEADTLLLATASEINLMALNLGAVGVKWHPRGIQVNSRLQTTHPKIYACGASLGGNANEALAQHEAAIALQNALFLPTARVKDTQVPMVLRTTPQFARVGLTAGRAQQAYGRNVVILKQPMQMLISAQVQGETTGFCKLIVHRNGKILGAHWVGMGASEAIYPIALAIQQQIKIEALARLPVASPTVTEILQAIAQQWQQHRYQAQAEWREGWFRWCRAWSS
jgi:pyruvate/2-oxoglutarate dehydrogenase complex dihydrolipoamide dehydrogenase (E3) component